MAIKVAVAIQLSRYYPKVTGCTVFRTPMDILAQTTTFYHETSKKYALLAEEIAFLLEQSLQSQSIPVAHVTWRLKSLESLLSKVKRKSYNDPKSQISDIAGVRIVFLYPSDFSAIDRLINSEFLVTNSVDLPPSHTFEQFGYSAHHFDIRVSPKYYGPRYDGVRGLNCEVQVRTVMQDAWALISHHLEYKSEGSVPVPVRRQLHALSGALEVADSHLDHLRAQRAIYVSSLKNLSFSDSIDIDLNYDAFLAFLKEQHPDLRLETTRGAANSVYEYLQAFDVSKVQDLRRLYQDTESARIDFFESETWGPSQARHAFVALGLTYERAINLFAHEEDKMLIAGLRAKHGTLKYS